MKKIKKIISLLAVFLVISIVVSSFSTANSIKIRLETTNNINICNLAIGNGYTLHEPIVINEDEDFTAENGVTGGSGTKEDPYIIEGWEIDLSLYPPSKGYKDGIQIIRTSITSPITKYFVIRNCYIHNSMDDQDGIVILIRKSGLGRIENCITEKCDSGIYISADNFQVKNCLSKNNAMGIKISSSINVVIDHCNIYNNIFDGIIIYCRSRVIVTNCNINNNLFGIYCIGSGSIIIPIILKVNNNNFQDNENYDIFLEKSFGNARNNYWNGSGPIGKIRPFYRLFFLFPFPYLKEPNPDAGPQ